MITYAPHFISTVVYVGMITLFLGREGVVNNIIVNWAAPLFPLWGRGSGSVIFMSGPVFESTGWNSIMYISVLATVPPEPS
jgi:putative aldouronate transport system permease protein